MTINITMSKEEFLEYLNYKDFKNNVKCGIIDINTEFNDLLQFLLEDGIWSDNNKYDKKIKSIIQKLGDIERGASK